MPKRYILFFAALLLLASPTLRAQDAQPTLSKSARFLSHFDLGASGIAFFTKDVSGTVSSGASGAPYSFTQSASSAAGVIGMLRGQKSPYKGFEVTYGYGRVAQSYTCCQTNTSTGAYNGPLIVQATATEYTVGYLARPPHPIFGFQPFVSAGAGTYAFKPTANGGQGLQTQARMAYYYHVGGESMISTHFGVRAGFRQLFYKAPDFGQNYLKITKTTFTSEPEIGVFLHF